MKLQQYLQRQLEGELWAQQLIATALQEANNPEERSLMLFSHIGAAYHNWHQRMVGETKFIPIFDVLPVSDSLQLGNSALHNLMELVKNASDEMLEKVIPIKIGAVGSNRTITLADAIAHSITHASYHRGQIVAQLKGKLEPLPATSYILYASKNLHSDN